MKRRAAGTLIAALLVTAAFAGNAAAWRFEGETAQSRWVTVDIGPDGLLRSAKIAWAVRCRRVGITHAGSTVFVPPLGHLSPDGFAETGTYRARAGRYRAWVTATIAGTHNLDPLNLPLESWSGRLDVYVLLTARGRVVDRCRTRGVSWEAFLL